MDPTRISATELGRRLADILDELQHERRHFVIVRRGREIAELQPVAIGQSAEFDDPAPPDMPASIPSDVRSILRPKRDCAELLVSLLDRLSGLGMRLSPPSGTSRDDYVNVHLPGRSSRVLSVNARTGRSEFQQNSWDRLGGTDPLFERLPAGNKAAHRLETPFDVERIVMASQSEIDSLRERSTVTALPAGRTVATDHEQNHSKLRKQDKVKYADESRRYKRQEDWDCLMWAWNEIPEVQAKFGGPGPWRQACGGETRYASRTDEAHAILKRHNATITSGLPRKKFHFTRPNRTIEE